MRSGICDQDGHSSCLCTDPQRLPRCAYCSMSGHTATQCKKRMQANELLFVRRYVNEPIDDSDPTAVMKNLHIDFVPQSDRTKPRTPQNDFRTFVPEGDHGSAVKPTPKCEQMARELPREDIRHNVNTVAESFVALSIASVHEHNNANTAERIYNTEIELKRVEDELFFSGDKTVQYFLYFYI